MSGNARHDGKGAPGVGWFAPLPRNGRSTASTVRPQNTSHVGVGENDRRSPKRTRDRSLRPSANASSSTPKRTLPWAVAASACALAITIKVSDAALDSLPAGLQMAPLQTVLEWSVLIFALAAVLAAAAQLFVLGENTSNQTAMRASAGDENPPALSRTIGDGLKTTTPATVGNIANVRLPDNNDPRLRLAQSLSHELRTPLNAVIGFSSLMNAQAFGSLGHPKYDEYCAHISASGHDLLRTVDDLLALQPERAGTTLRGEKHALVAALRDAWDGDQPCLFSASETPSLVVNAHSDASVAVIAPPMQLAHALRNIAAIANAHTRSGTAVHATVSAEDGHAVIMLESNLDALHAVETAPLLSAIEPVSKAGEPRNNRDTLKETASRVLVEAMDGTLDITETNGQRVIRCALPLAS
ncbi:MAG: HAMP domain-containing sensor histidine kinase [Pseudomonadota bacterium]